MANIRKARGTEVVKAPYQELYEGSRPSIHGLKPAAFLPIVREDKRHEDDPVVLEPGTLVGLLAGALVPASSSSFNLAYADVDVEWSVNLQDGTTAATSGGTEALEAVKPIGIITAPVYSSLLEDAYTNYKRDLTPSILSGNYSILVPCTNASEHLIEPGDKVVAEDGRFASLAQEISGLATSTDLTAAELTRLVGDFAVGRCVNKITVASSSESAGGIAAQSAAGLAVSDSRFSTLSKVQTVPGLGLTGSETQGLPQMVWQHGVTEATSGDIAVLEIRIDL